ncbi:MAG: hypothetical protein QXX47_00075 [Sulfolobales archaeon]
MWRKIDADDIYTALVGYVNKISSSSEKSYRILISFIDKLVELNKIRALSLNHSMMELAVARYLVESGFENVDIEIKLDADLVADVVGYKGARTVVEIETGFVPAEYSHEPLQYLKARLTSKIARYSALADVFILAFPTYYLPPIPKILLKKPKERAPTILKELKSLVDKYYRNPPIDYELIERSLVQKLFVLNVDSGRVIELSPEDLIEIYEAIGKLYMDPY